MFLQRSISWPSPPAFFSKFLRSTSTPPTNPNSPPTKPKRWSFPQISLPTLPPLRSFLQFRKKDEDSGCSPQSNITAEHFQICINLVHHIINVCALGCIWLCSPIFQVTLDVFGVRGALKLWIHGLGIFLATTYGMYILLWVAQEYLLQLTSMYGILQILVLSVSLKSERKVEEMAIEEPEPMNCEEEEEGEEEREPQEDRWAGGSEDEVESEDGWETEGKEEENI
ncbi:uncharacterized protein C6orf47 homolog [Discoglossus pictus]